MVSFSLFSPPSEASSSQDTQDNAVDGANVAKKPLDIVFLQDTTGSQGPYIKAARQAIRDICDKISTIGELSTDLIRFGLIAFRDHPPQDKTYITKNYGFTSDINVMQQNLAKLVASGGGDGPEAQTAALADALNMEWADNAVKLVILITDSPPHGLGEKGDFFSESPDQNDPLEIVRQMAERGITLFVVACEPSLSTMYKNALDFYTALTKITSGQVFPLLMADKLGDYIVGTAVEIIETEILIGEFEKVIVDDVYNNATPMEKVAENLQQYINSKGTKINTIVIEDIYVHNTTAEGNRNVWGKANNISEARGSIQPIHEARIQPKFVPVDPDEMDSDSWDEADEDSESDTTDQSEGRSQVVRPAVGPRGADVHAKVTRTPLSFAARAPISPRASHLPPAQIQQVSLETQQVSHMQAQRIVAQSIARNSKVTAAGMFSKETGQAAANGSTPPTE